ncbi:hypothetical protein [Telmatospirillum sp.]|uniref:hypothetical protein n=1 Tax=Telmatospirillum sp. TaxID=2079197 RepID=UPI00284EACB1|nr:hypothetical protein [Telmatospirillum sp.]MDR3441210.1 hypothetical protein [Telmatospirillum sp.]
MKLDFLFSNRDFRRSWRDRLTPRFSRAEEDLAQNAAEAGAREETKLALPPPHLNTAVRNMSPRQLAAWAHEMYLTGALTWEEYRVAGFHAELHPDYNATVGALTGHPATPDRPRDMVREWQDRLAFYHRHNPSQDPQVRRVEKVLSLLSTQPAPTKGRRYF